MLENFRRAKFKISLNVFNLINIQTQKQFFFLSIYRVINLKCRVRNEIVEYWKSKAWNNITDIIDFEVCFEECLKLIDENNL